MVERHPHKMIYTTLATPDVYDENTGQWMPGQSGADVIINCRARPAGAGKKKAGKDGQLTEYAYDLGFEYDPNFNVPPNAVVRIIGVNDRLIFEGELKGYQIGNESILGWI
jgi:hypothetical protein